MKKDIRVHSGKTSTSVNPQGYSEDVKDQQPTTELQERAKKKNTKS
ncbi:MAG TPA: small, acid-soluble spore protein L [Candidatus Angelobacter sp.]|nr:small, acid-soluble spore protein L [Candidatus Angelobacter sp.]